MDGWLDASKESVSPHSGASAKRWMQHVQEASFECITMHPCTVVQVVLFFFSSRDSLSGTILNVTDMFLPLHKAVMPPSSTVTAQLFCTKPGKVRV